MPLYQGETHLKQTNKHAAPRNWMNSLSGRVCRRVLPCDRWKCSASHMWGEQLPAPHHHHHHPAPCHHHHHYHHHHHHHQVNNAQHLIYSVTPDSGPSQLSVILSVQSTQSSNARLWNMRVYQYECTSPVLAPVGCLQHFTGASGMVRQDQ